MYEFDEAIQELFAPDIKAQEEIRRKTGEQGEKLRIAASNLLSSDDGKRVLCAMLDESGIFKSSFTGNSTTFYLQGKRDMGLYLLQLLLTADNFALHKLIQFRITDKGVKSNV